MRSSARVTLVTVSGPPSGEQYELSYGTQRATVVEVGGGLREYEVDGVAVLDGYPIEQRCTGARGLPLIPWPNRIADGAYRFEGIDHQLPLTEPDKHNAIHGLLRWRNWQCHERSGKRVVMTTTLHPMMGYPFTLQATVEYQLGPQGLTVQTRGTNLGSGVCPYGAGQHPYLSAGGGLVDTGQLAVDAGLWISSDDRGLPNGTAAVDGSPVDFRTGRTIGSQDLDLTFTELSRGDDGLAWVRFARPDGIDLALWMDASYPFVEIYTSHTQPAPHWRTGLGVEPMTCAPNAYRTGRGLIRLAPGQSTQATWGLHAAAAQPVRN